MGENLLEMHNISKSFGEVAAVHASIFAWAAMRSSACWATTAPANRP